MNKKKIISIIYFICSILWAISALLNAVSSNIPICVANIGLTVTFFCLGILYWQKRKNDSDNSKD